MPEAKITLEQMAEACRDRSLALRVANRIWSELGQPENAVTVAEARVFDQAAHVFDIMATFEDDSRAFISAKLKEHAI